MKVEYYPWLHHLYCPLMLMRPEPLYPFLFLFLSPFPFPFLSLSLSPSPFPAPFLVPFPPWPASVAAYGMNWMRNWIGPRHWAGIGNY